MAAVRQICEGLSGWAAKIGKPKRDLPVAQPAQEAAPAPRDAELQGKLQGIYEQGLSAPALLLHTQ